MFIVTQQQNSPVIMYPDSGTYVSGVSQFSAKFRIVLTGNQTSNRSAVVDGFIYNSAASRHQIHTREDEIMLVLNGTLQIDLNGFQFCAPAGTTIYIPQGTPQSQRNLDSNPVHIQIKFSPSGYENYLIQLTPFLLQPTINQTAVTILNQNYGFISLPEVTWNDLKCWPNNNVVNSFASRKNIVLKEFSIIFAFSLFLCFF